MYLKLPAKGDVLRCQVRMRSVRNSPLTTSITPLAALEKQIYSCFKGLARRGIARLMPGNAEVRVCRFYPCKNGLPPSLFPRACEARTMKTLILTISKLKDNTPNYFRLSRLILNRLRILPSGKRPGHVDRPPCPSRRSLTCPSHIKAFTFFSQWDMVDAISAY